MAKVLITDKNLNVLHCIETTSDMGAEFYAYRHTGGDEPHIIAFNDGTYSSDNKELIELINNTLPLEADIEKEKYLNKQASMLVQMLK